MDEGLKKVAQSDEPSSWLTIGFGLIAGLFVLIALGNFLGTCWFFKISSMGSFFEVMMSSAVALLAAQVFLVAIWLTLGSQRFLLRFCLSLGTLFALICLYVAGVSYNEDSLPAEIPLIILGIASVGVGITSIPLGLLRWKGRRVISRKIVEYDAEASQFGIRHLLIATAVTAVLIPLAQGAFSNHRFEGGAPWGEILCFLAIYILLSCLLCLLSLAFIFAEHRRLMNFVLLAGVVLLGSPIAICVLAATFNVFEIGLGDSIFNSIVYSTTLSSALVSILGIFWAFGYRLQRA